MSMQVSHLGKQRVLISKEPRTHDEARTEGVSYDAFGVWIGVQPLLKFPREKHVAKLNCRKFLVRKALS